MSFWPTNEAQNRWYRVKRLCCTCSQPISASSLLFCTTAQRKRSRPGSQTVSADGSSPKHGSSTGPLDGTWETPWWMNKRATLITVKSEWKLYGLMILFTDDSLKACQKHAQKTNKLILNYNCIKKRSLLWGFFCIVTIFPCKLITQFLIIISISIFFILLYRKNNILKLTFMWENEKTRKNKL